MLHGRSGYPLRSAWNRDRIGVFVSDTRHTIQKPPIRMVAIREVSDDDLGRLADYLPAQPPFLHTTQEIWKRRFGIWWASNPAFTSRFPRGWVLEDETSLLGFIGNVPVKFVVCGEKKTAVAAVAWYVDPSVRGLSSIRLFNEFLKQKDASLFLFNTDTENLMSVLHRNRFKKYILPPYERKYLYVLDRMKMKFILIELGILTREGFSSVGSLSAMVKQIGSFLSDCIHQKPAVGLTPLQERDYTVSLCTSCDESFSKIWRRPSSRCDVTLSRDVETLNWIYFSSVEPSQRIVIQCRRTIDDSLAGYMVFDVRRKRASERAIMKLMDMCVEGDDLDVIASLLQFATKTARHHDVPLLELWALDEGTETYLRSTFIVNRADQHHNFIRLSDLLEPQSEALRICPSMIAPPRGTDHF